MPCAGSYCGHRVGCLAREFVTCNQNRTRSRCPELNRIQAGNWGWRGSQSDELNRAKTSTPLCMGCLDCLHRVGNARDGARKPEIQSPRGVCNAGQRPPCSPPQSRPPTRSAHQLKKCAADPFRPGSGSRPSRLAFEIPPGKPLGGTRSRRQAPRQSHS